MSSAATASLKHGVANGGDGEVAAHQLGTLSVAAGGASNEGGGTAGPEASQQSRRKSVSEPTDKMESFDILQGLGSYK